jgi:hypothetical protein
MIREIIEEAAVDQIPEVDLEVDQDHHLADHPVMMIEEGEEAVLKTTEIGKVNQDLKMANKFKSY